MKKIQSIYAFKTPKSLLPHVGMMSFGLILVSLCLFFSLNAPAYGDIIPPGHWPNRPGNQEIILNPPEESLFPGTSSPVAIENMPGLNLILTPLIRYWMPSFGSGGDHMTSVKGLKENLPKGTLNQGTLYYVNANAADSTLPLFRLLSLNSDMDHMDSNSTDVPGYQAERFLGNSFVSAYDAAVPIKSMVKDYPMDHLTAFHGETPDGYTDDGVLGYGYPRFGELDAEGKTHNPILSQIAYNGVTINADLSWGGVIYELWWNGKQFVNHNDCGREIQTALFKPGLADTQFGPTEAGDRMFQGSPVAEMQVSPKSLYTRSLPLQWDPRSYGGGSNNPVLYGGEFDRNARFMLHPAYKIIRYTIGFKPAESTNYLREWVTAYLNLDVSDRFYMNTAQGGMEEIPKPPDSNYVTRSIDEGAIITASSDLSYAIGFFTPSPAYISWYNFDGQESASDKTRKIDLWDTDAYMEAGVWQKRTVYLIIGSLKEVQDAITFLRDIQRLFPAFLNQDLLPDTANGFVNPTN
ncbi:MAG: hypothetical protein HY881_26625 [Deltaproteobacteria bacterium]|nr:hypothetical protein [Deltaproteobacteria bacterium]